MDVRQKLIKAIRASKNIIIISHVGPDGDTLGSMLALREMIFQLDLAQKIDILIQGKIPDIYKFLPDINLVKNLDNRDLYQSYDLVIVVDCASIDRVGDAAVLLRNAKLTANIDHHISNTKFAEINWVDSKAAATGEILYELVNLLGVKLTKNIATNLYAAILTDTGGFKFDNTRPETHEVVAQLLKTDIDHTAIYKECYESKPLAMVRLQARALDMAVFLDGLRIAYTAVDRKMLQEFNATDDYIDGISETLRQINTVEVAMVLKETMKGDTKISFRSNRVNVCRIANFFGGGGHVLAAGCTIQKNIEDSINEVIPIIKKEINKI